MKKIATEVLLNGLQADLREIILKADTLMAVSPAVLERIPAPGRWSVAQVLDHLNFYCGYYMPAIEKKLHLYKGAPAPLFKPGWLGDYFTKLMRPREDGSLVKKMKAPGNAVPKPQPDATIVLQAFIRHQHHLLNLLHVAAGGGLSDIRIPASLSKWITLSMGDTFRFLIAHQQRHFIQIDRILEP